MTAGRAQVVAQDGLFGCFQLIEIAWNRQRERARHNCKYHQQLDQGETCGAMAGFQMGIEKSHRVHHRFNAIPLRPISVERLRTS